MSQAVTRGLKPRARTRFNFAVVEAASFYGLNESLIRVNSAMHFKNLSFVWTIGETKWSYVGVPTLFAHLSVRGPGALQRLERWRLPVGLTNGMSSHSA